jgi:hypothetical protein
MDAWVEHTRGAIALLELRGDDQLAGESGLQMFSALRNEIVCTPIPFSFHYHGANVDHTNCSWLVVCKDDNAFQVRSLHCPSEQR